MTDTNKTRKTDSHAPLSGVVESYSYLRNKVYENVKHRANGRLYIGTFYVRKVAEMLGGNYELLLIRLINYIHCCV
jgi:hypothetical protein